MRCWRSAARWHRSSRQCTRTGDNLVTLAAARCADLACSAARPITTRSKPAC